MLLSGDLLLMSCLSGPLWADLFTGRETPNRLPSSPFFQY